MTFWFFLSTFPFALPWLSWTQNNSLTQNKPKPWTTLKFETWNLKHLDPKTRLWGWTVRLSNFSCLLFSIIFLMVLHILEGQKRGAQNKSNCHVGVKTPRKQDKEPTQGQKLGLKRICSNKWNGSWEGDKSLAWIFFKRSPVLHHIECLPFFGSLLGHPCDLPKCH